MKQIVFLAIIGIAQLAVAAPQPNVLFIVADDFRAELASYGSPAITPNLDRLAKRTLQFDRAYAQQAVCNPSRSSFLTGRRPDTLKIWNNGTHFREINPDVMTLPLWFKEHGYDTRCVGKIFHNWHTKVFLVRSSHGTARKNTLPCATVGLPVTVKIRSNSLYWPPIRSMAWAYFKV